MTYDYYKEQGKRFGKGKLSAGIIIFLLLIACITAVNIYLEIVQLNEIGSFSSVYIKNLVYQIVFSSASFTVIFIAISLANRSVKKNITGYLKENGLEARKLPNYSIAFLTALAGAFLTRDVFYQKALNFFNATSFGSTDPIYSRDIGYYVFQRPFLMTLYEFAATLWMFVIIYTAAYYVIVLTMSLGSITIQDLKIRSILRHNLVNLSVFFLIKAFSYKFEGEGILYSSFLNVRGAGYIDVNLWQIYYIAAPFLLILLVLLAFMFIWKSNLRKAAYTIGVFPAVWLIVSILSGILQVVIVKPNEISMESRYLKYNMVKTREAYGLDRINNIDFQTVQDLTPEVINRNAETKNNIRIVDYKATLNTNTQLQSNTNFYSFHEGDIINYTINGKEVPVFISAREIDRNKLPEKSYMNTTYQYTHGYGVVINPINRLTSEGQADFILSGLKMNSIDKNLKVTEPRIYFGELTREHVIVNPPNSNKLQEIDYDGNVKNSYQGNGGIKLSLINRLLFALRYGDLNMIISGNISSESKLLLNREVITRAQKALPFLSVDKDPYIIINSDGRLEWVLDGYTTTNYYPYAQNYGNFNYIRNSVKITVDAYDGDVKCYVIDKDDPIINTYRKIYSNVFSDEPLPQDVATHSRYPEMLFKIQTDVLKRYHLDPEKDEQNVSMFYSNLDLWDIAKYPVNSDAAGGNTADPSDIMDIEPYYNMIKLPGDIGKKEELILMRPFTPSSKHNMVSWLAVRNSYGNNGDIYGQLILFNFPKDTNILGPYQVEANINSIDKISKDMTLWGQGGSRVFKGSLLVIPIESSVLYVEPIYIQSSGQSSIPQVRQVVAGYQKGEEFKYGIGANLDEALSQLFGTSLPSQAAPSPTVPIQPENGKTGDEKLVNDILKKYDDLKKQLEELDKLMSQLRK